MPDDIIDNRELHLVDAVRPLLSESVRAHFAVGCFFLSGFKAIAGQLATVQELRLLIGNTSDRATIEQLAEGHASREAISRLEALSFEHKLEVLAERQVGIRQFAADPAIICTEALV